MHRFLTFFLLIIPLSVCATEIVMSPVLLGSDCNPCEIKSPGRESINISYEIEGIDNWKQLADLSGWEGLVDLRLNDMEFNDLNISFSGLHEHSYFPFYGLNFLTITGCRFMGSWRARD